MAVLLTRTNQPQEAGNQPGEESICLFLGDTLAQTGVHLKYASFKIKEIILLYHDFCSLQFHMNFAKVDRKEGKWFEAVTQDPG